MTSKIKQIVKRLRKNNRQIETDLRWLEATGFHEIDGATGEKTKEYPKRLREQVERNKDLIKAYEGHLAKKP